MAQYIRDTFDFSAYMRETEASAKVKRASEFTEELLSEFGSTDRPARVAEMFSTKLRDRLAFRPGETTVWAGYNGHRKSMFAGQVALDLMHSGERVLLMSFEMRPSSTLARIARQAHAVAKPSKPALEAFSRWTNGRLWIFDHLGRIDADRCLAVARYFSEELSGSHIFIDSMMMVCKSEEHLDEQKQFATDIVRAAQEYGIHIHLIAHCRKPASGEDKPPTKYDLRGSAAISDQAHNVCTVYANKSKVAKLEKDGTCAEALAEPDAIIAVEKQRNGAWEGRVKLWFSPLSFRFYDERSTHVEPYVMI